MQITKAFSILLMTTLTPSVLASTAPAPARNIDTVLIADEVAHSTQKNLIPSPAFYPKNAALLPAVAISENLQFKHDKKTSLSALLTEESVSEKSATEIAAVDCDDNAFVTSGSNLLRQIKEQSYDCVGRLFTDASEAVRLGTFTEANILNVANEAKNQSIS